MYNYNPNLGQNYLYRLKEKVQIFSIPAGKTINPWQWVWNLRNCHPEKSLPNAMFSFDAVKMHPFDLLCKHHYCRLFVLSSLFFVRKDTSGEALEDVKTLSRSRLLKSCYLWMPTSEKSPRAVSSPVHCTRFFQCSFVLGQEVGKNSSPGEDLSHKSCCLLLSPGCIQGRSPVTFCFPITTLSSP